MLFEKKRTEFADTLLIISNGFQPPQSSAGDTGPPQFILNIISLFEVALKTSKISPNGIKIAIPPQTSVISPTSFTLRPAYNTLEMHLSLLNKY